MYSARNRRNDAMDLKIEGTQLETVIQTALLQALGAAGQEALVKEVVRHLTTPPPSSGYGRPLGSPLMQALQRASEQAADRYFRERLEKDPEFVAALESLYTDAFKRFNSAESREKTITRMAERLSGAFDKDY
jgi:hypothetical protein